MLSWHIPSKWTQPLPHICMSDIVLYLFYCCNQLAGEDIELVALLLLSFWCHMANSVILLLLAVPMVALQYVIVAFPSFTHLLLENPVWTHNRTASIMNIWVMNIMNILPIAIRSSDLSCWTQMCRDMWFPTMRYFDKCRLRRACAASF